MFTVLVRAPTLTRGLLTGSPPNDSLAHQSLFNAIQPVMEYDWRSVEAGVDFDET